MDFDTLMIVIVALIILIMAITLLMGKEAFLVAGYHMASKEEKSRYDEVKLCHTMGDFLIFCDVLLMVQMLDIIAHGS